MTRWYLLALLVWALGCVHTASDMGYGSAANALAARSIALGSAPEARPVVSAAAAHNDAEIVRVNAPVVLPVNTPAATSWRWLHGASLHARVVQGTHSQGYVGLWVNAPETASRPRVPVAVALVVDTSGSMGGEKIQHAVAAAQAFAGSLADGDVIAVYAFSNEARVVVPPTVIRADVRSYVRQEINALVAAGSTNMAGGLFAAEGMLRALGPEHRARRVVLISDGAANVGLCSPEELASVAARSQEYGAQVSAVGIGLDYDPATLSAIATRTSGRMYHLENTAQMASVLNEELGLLGTTVADSASIVVTPAPGVALLGVEGAHAEREGAGYRVRLGAIHAGQRLQVLVRVAFDARETGDRPVVQARFEYNDTQGTEAARAEALELYCEVTRDAAAAHDAPNEYVQLLVSNYEASQEQLRATEMLAHGRGAEAVATLDAVEQRLRAEAARVRGERERERLRRAAEQVREQRSQAVTATRTGDHRGAMLRIHHAAAARFRMSLE